MVVAAHNEADRIAATLEAVGQAFPRAEVVVADDASSDGTAEVALSRGAQVVSRGRPHGKGANVTAAVQAVIDRAEESEPPTFLLCDADLGASARELTPLVEAVEGGTVTWQSRRSGIGWAAASGSPAGSRDGRSSAAAGIEQRRPSPASAPCPPASCGRCFRSPPDTAWRRR